MGMGQAMCEETRYLDGLPGHASFLEYRMPTAAESPPIEVQIVESHDPFGPFGAKEASEGALAGFPPALVNAIANAIDIDIDELPVTPDRIMDVLIQRRRQARLTSTVKEAVAARFEHPGSRFIAGGTDLIVNMRRGITRSDLLVDLSGIDELTEITTDGVDVTIGAGVTLAALARNSEIAGRYRALAQAAEAIAAPGHRVIGTVGGNLCLDTRCIYYNQSDWWRGAIHHCLKTTGDICHVAPKSQGVCFATFSGATRGGWITTPKRMAAGGTCLLSEKPRRCLSCRTAGTALPCGLCRRPRPRPACFRGRNRHRRRTGSTPDSSERALCRRRQGTPCFDRRRTSCRAAPPVKSAAVRLC